MSTSILRLRIWIKEAQLIEVIKLCSQHGFVDLRIQWQLEARYVLTLEVNLSSESCAKPFFKLASSLLTMRNSSAGGYFVVDSNLEI